MEGRMNTFEKTGQQGDVLISAVKDFPKGSEVSIKKNMYVIAEGETTGHLHGIPVEDGVDVCVLDDKVFMKNDHSVTIHHDEHAPIEIPEGVWQFDIVQEYDHFLEETRKVQD